jgi:hypothetical protein
LLSGALYLHQTARHLQVHHGSKWYVHESGELLKTEQRAWRIPFAPDGLRLVSAKPKDVRISDAATSGDIIKRFDAHENHKLCLPMATNSPPII